MSDKEIKKLAIKYLLCDNFSEEDFNKLSEKEKKKFIEIVEHHSMVKPQ